MVWKWSWFSVFPIVLLGLQSIPDSHFSFFSAVTHSKILQIMNKWTILLQHYKSWYQKWALLSYLQNPIRLIKLITLTNGRHCSKVWIVTRIGKPLKAPYSSPFKILQWSPNFLLIESSTNILTHISINKLKPYIKLSTQDKIANMKTQTKVIHKNITMILVLLIQNNNKNLQHGRKTIIIITIDIHRHF